MAIKVVVPTRSQSLPLVRGVRIDAAAATAPQRALIQAADQANATVARLGADIAASRRKAELSAARTEAAMQLNAFEAKLDRDTDYTTHIERFEARAAELKTEISKRLDVAAARTAFEQDFDAFAATKKLQVAKRAWALEIDARTAGLDIDVMQTAKTIAGSKSAAERLALESKTLKAIADAAEDGIITQVDAAKRAEGFRSLIAEADARQLITADPEAAVEELAKPDSVYSQALDPKAHARMLDFATRRADTAVKERARLAEKAERDAEKAIKARGDASLKEAWSRQASGALTRDYVDHIRADISPAEYHSLLKAIDPSSEHATDDPETYRDLMAGLRSDPEGTRSAAFRAHAEGRLKNSTLQTVVTAAEAVTRRTGPADPYSRTREFLERSLRPPPTVDDPASRIRAERALQAFDDWVVAAPADAPRTPAEIRDQADRILSEYSLVDLSSMAIALPQPRFGTVPRAGDDLAAVEAAIDAAEAETVRRFEAGEIGRDVLEAQARTVFQPWRAWLERKRAAPPPKRER